MSAYYRIVTDAYAGFEVQVRSLLIPFWHQPKINTHGTVEEAEAFAVAHANRRDVVKCLGKLS